MLEEHAIYTFMAGEKSMPTLKASKDRLTLSLGANTAGDFKLRPVLIYRSPNPRAFKNFDKSTLCSLNGTIKLEGLHICS